MIKETVMVVGAHPDDETFGCGGTLALNNQMGNQVYVLCLSCNPENRRKELQEAAKELGINEPKIFDAKEVSLTQESVRQVSDQIVNVKPTIMITHLPFDYHREHKVTHDIVKEAIEWAGHTTTYNDPWVVKRLLLMEVNTLIPQPHVNVNVSKAYNMKREAIKRFKTQLDKFPSGYYEKFNHAKALLRGVQGGCEFAESYLEEAIASHSPFFREKTANKLFS